jgi:Putative MetA-pathway of phenol degradation
LCRRAAFASSGVGVALVIAALAPTAEAQSLEPQAYANTPVGMNFLFTGYTYTKGDVALDASAPVGDGEITVHTTFLGYARSLDLWGRAGKFDVELPYAWLSGTAKFEGQSFEREVSGFGDPRLRLSVLPYGAPALSLDEFADYKPDLIIGASFAVTVPVGQYDPNKLVNIGTNRWSFKPELGISKTLGPLTLELDASVTFYTANHDFFGGQTLEREPLYALQGHVIYNTPRGLWVALDATYYAGGAKKVGGLRGERQENLRLGATLAIPVDRRNSIKLFGSTGAVARAGGDYDTVGIAWQFRWGGGL